MRTKIVLILRVAMPVLLLKIWRIKRQYSVVYKFSRYLYNIEMYDCNIDKFKPSFAIDLPLLQTKTTIQQRDGII